jgi:transposase
METITMTVEEQRRAWALTRVLKGALTMAEAAGELGLSERHLWRLRSAFERDGPAALVHGNRGRSSPRRVEPQVRARVVGLRRTRYGELNDSHFTELLAEREGIVLSRETVRAILRAEGLASSRRRRPPRHRSRRPRMVAEGQLLQLDGSPHGWLEARGPRLSLLGAIDDATGRVPAAVFRVQEDAAGYLMVLHAIVTTKGLPEAVYRDRHGVFGPTQRRRRGEDGPPHEETLSQVGRALSELGIGSIAARSPQAKGRIERLWGTFQDRLVVEMRLAGIADLAAANDFLPGFLARYDERFAVPAADPVPAWRPIPPGLRLERVLVFKYLRKVAKDHTVRLDGRVLQLPRWGAGPSYAGRRVEVHVRLDGSIVAFDGERELAALPAPAEPVQLRAQHVLRAAPGLVPAPATMPWIPPADHPWKRITPDRKRYQRLTGSPGS